MGDGMAATDSENMEQTGALEVESDLAARSELPTQFFKTQRDAVGHLQAIGYKISTSQFNRAVKNGQMPRQQAGFSSDDLAVYAGNFLAPIKKVANQKKFDADLDKSNARAELDRVRVQRQRLMLAKEKGEIFSRAQYEEEMSARALFFRSEIENFGHRKAGEIIALVNGNESRLQELVSWWRRETEDWMDAWDTSRDFGVHDDGLSEDLPEETPVEEEHGNIH